MRYSSCECLPVVTSSTKYIQPDQTSASCLLNTYICRRCYVEGYGSFGFLRIPDKNNPAILEKHKAIGPSLHVQRSFTGSMIFNHILIGLPLLIFIQGFASALILLTSYSINSR
jgi:hypothetical protein